jgi:hypothetical protein
MRAMMQWCPDPLRPPLRLHPARKGVLRSLCCLIHDNMFCHLDFL